MTSLPNAENGRELDYFHIGKAPLQQIDKGLLIPFLLFNPISREWKDFHKVHFHNALLDI